MRIIPRRTVLALVVGATIAAPGIGGSAWAAGGTGTTMHPAGGTSPDVQRPSTAGVGLPQLRVPESAAPPAELRAGRSLGDPSAPVHIDVYEDPQCPVCARFEHEVLPWLIDGPIRDGTVFLTYRDMLFIGPDSWLAAVAMRTADDLGAFWDYAHILYANQAGENRGGFNRSRLAAMAVMVGLDRDAFLRGLDDPGRWEAARTEVRAAMALGMDAVPTMVINGTLHPGIPSAVELQAAIDAAMTAAPSASPGPS
ncbi:MAG: thioredoxin domain-containing protein [Chloroflexota bacterium]